MSSFSTSSLTSALIELSFNNSIDFEFASDKYCITSALEYTSQNCNSALLVIKVVTRSISFAPGNSI